jgi:hypothetical protein
VRMVITSPGRKSPNFTSTTLPPARQACVA